MASGFILSTKSFPKSIILCMRGGPAVARIKLYEIDPDKNAPVINKPKNLPQRVLMFDWERQPDHQPADLVAYAKLMGYNAISPVILKWGFANYSDPLNGYNSVNVDARDYWVTRPYQPLTQDAGPALPGRRLCSRQVSGRDKELRRRLCSAHRIPAGRLIFPSRREPSPAMVSLRSPSALPLGALTFCIRRPG